tara:strand:- start:2677 stop:3093 length:417 start_codon:yes stop_codon:yes gene_type:complete
MANPLALKALRIGGKIIKKVAKKLTDSTKNTGRGMSFKPAPGQEAKNYAQKLDHFMKTSPVKTGKKRASWAKKHNLPEYPGSPRGQSIRHAADKYQKNVYKGAHKELKNLGKNNVVKQVPGSSFKIGKKKEIKFLKGR